MGRRCSFEPFLEAKVRQISLAKFGIGFALALLAVSCGEGRPNESEFTDAQRDEITDLADDVADDAIEHSLVKIQELEQRISEQDSKIQELETRLSDFES